MHLFHCDRAKLFRDLLDHFGIDVDVNVVADDHAAVVHSGVPFHAEVLTVNLGGGVHGGALIAPRIFDACRASHLADRIHAQAERTDLWCRAAGCWCGASD